MRRSWLCAIVLVSLWGTLSPVQAQQHALKGQMRGQVVDPDGKAIAGVAVTMEFEGRPPRTYNLTTDKRGGFIRVGIADGSYKLTMTKEGYRPTGVTIWISLGGLSEIPPVTMHPLEVGAAASPAAGQAARASAPASRISDADVAKINEIFGRAVAAGKAGQLDQAEALYKEILTISDNVAEAHYNLGYTYEQRRSFSQAESEYRRTLELEPGKGDSYVALARVLEAAGQSEQALALLAEAAERFADDARLQLSLGVRYFDLSLADQATAAFQRARVLDASDPEPLYFLGMLAVQKGLVPEAVAGLEKYVALSGQDPKNLQTARELLGELKKASSKH
jgi:Flp pilus assembly protein TadD